MTRLTDPKVFLENLEYEKYDGIMKDYTIINRNEVEKELAESPSVYAYFGAVLEEAKKKMELCDLAVKRADANFRSKRRSEGKISESRLNSEVYQDEDYNECYKTFLEAQKKYGWMKSLCVAMHSKHEALIQLSSNRRAEMKLNSI